MLHVLALSATVATIDVSLLYKNKVVAESSLRVEVSRGVYTLDGTPVDPKTIHALRDALSAPAFPSPTLEALGLDDAGLKREAAARMTSCPSVAHSPAANAAYLKAFTDVAALSADIRDYFATGSVSGPDVAIRLDLPTATGDVVAKSGSRLSGLLPWRILRNGAWQSTYNAGIPDAVAALLQVEFARVNALPQNGVSVSEVVLGDAYPVLIARAWEDKAARRACSVTR